MERVRPPRWGLLPLLDGGTDARRKGKNCPFHLFSIPLFLLRYNIFDDGAKRGPDARLIV